MANAKFNDNAWTSLPEPDPSKPVSMINCRAENGKIVEVRVLRKDGTEATVEVFVDGKPALPMDIATFAVHFDKYELELR